MCIDDEYCEIVHLTRIFPRNKGRTPIEWLEGHDESQGLYDWVDYNDVLDDTGEESVGYYNTYRGAIRRSYSQPIFTLKSAEDVCVPCSNRPLERGTYYHLDDFDDMVGCECGNVAYASRDCAEHPLPSLNSRWMKMNQANRRCQMCRKRADQEVWDQRYSFYCNETCYWAHNKLKAKARQQRIG